MGKVSRILVTDDDPDLLLLYTQILGAGGYEVLEASSGAECLQAVRIHHPDIVLLDVMLPDMTGFEVCRRIKAGRQSKDALVLLISGVHVSSESQAEGLDCGAEGYVTRSISNKELLARIGSLVRIKRAEDALREKEEEQKSLISRLEQALAEIKTLEGFIPICASCKKIRDDKGYWNQLEAYLSKHTDAVFSHGLCPECLDKARAELRNLTK
jgi:DNA-binding response OmpR family regulator